eukprot:101429-Chlamydomonas_euryale.AAC.1
MKLTGVAYAPECPVNLLSMGRLNTAGGVYVSIGASAALMAPTNEAIVTTTKANGCFLFQACRP